MSTPGSTAGGNETAAPLPTLFTGASSLRFRTISLILSKGLLFLVFLNRVSEFPQTEINKIKEDQDCLTQLKEL